MKKILIFALLTLFVAGVSAQTQKQTKLIETKGILFEKQRGADPNIKTEKPSGDVVVPKERGPVYGDNYCDVNLENHSGYSIDIYIDGDYRGTIGPWENRVSWAIPGKTILYGKSIGGTVYWGPQQVDCGYIYTWRLWY